MLGLTKRKALIYANHVKMPLLQWKELWESGLEFFACDRIFVRPLHNSEW